MQQKLKNKKINWNKTNFMVIYRKNYKKGKFSTMPKSQKNPNANRLAKTQQNLDKFYNYIKEYVEVNGYSPSVRELCRVLGGCSTSTVFYYLLKLEKANLIKRRFGTNRAIEVVALTNSSFNKVATVPMPVIECNVCSKTYMNEENQKELYNIPERLFKRGDIFAAKMPDSAMSPDGILEGDMVVVRKQKNLADGDLAVVCYDHGLFIRRFYKEPTTFKLKASKKGVKDLAVKDLDILGIVVGVIRQY